MKKKSLKDRYLWRKFDWCIRCEALFSNTKKGVVAIVCLECFKELKLIQKRFERFGTYATVLKDKKERH